MLIFRESGAGFHLIFLKNIFKNLRGKSEHRVNANFLQQIFEHFRIPRILTVFPLMGAKNPAEKEFKR